MSNSALKPGLPVVDNPWSQLRRFTDARIGLGRAGVSIPTHEMLAFQLAHAQAQDAVHLALDTERLVADLREQDVLGETEALLQLHSQAVDRAVYLQRPDLGRRLDAASAARVRAVTAGDSAAADLAIVIADGLSALATQQHAAPFLAELIRQLEQHSLDWQLAPLTLVEQGRVAVGDEVGELLGSKCVLLLVGERPGLSSPDSLGLYLTWSPKVGLTDAGRNCVSNVRPAGLGYQEAVRKVVYLLAEARRQGISGVGLKDRSERVLSD